MTRSFSVTWDYRCPFARIGHEHILAGLAAGADWDVRFAPFSLDQAHVSEGGTSVFDEPDRHPGLIANLAGVAVRDCWPDQFTAAHGALFHARHAESLDLRDRSIVAEVLNGAGLDAGAVLAEVDSGRPLETLEREHTEAVERWQVWGVPTFIVGESAVFVRLMKGPDGDPSRSVAAVERIYDQITGWPELNEFKHTSLSN